MNKFVSFGALCLLLVQCVLPAQSTMCWIEPSNDFHERMPLVLQGNSDEFVYPSKCGGKAIRLTFRDNVRVACPSSSVTVFNTNTNSAEAKLTCYGLSLFGVGGVNYAAPFRRIRCNHIPQADIRVTNTTCTNGMIAKVGFTVSSTSFVPTIDEICMNNDQTHWTHHKVVPGLIKHKFPLFEKPVFKKGWGLGSWLRPTTTQSPVPVDNELIDTMYVPREDMLYRAQQDSTFSPINAMPMFKTVRNGNWRLVEDIIRKLANNRRQCATLDVWTGRYDAASATTEPPTTTTDVPTTTEVATTTTTAAPTTASTTTTTSAPTTASTTTTTSAPTTASTTTTTAAPTTASTTTTTVAPTTASTTTTTVAPTTASTTTTTVAPTTASTTTTTVAPTTASTTTTTVAPTTASTTTTTVAPTTASTTTTTVAPTTASTTTTTVAPTTASTTTTTVAPTTASTTTTTVAPTTASTTTTTVAPTTASTTTTTVAPTTASTTTTTVAPTTASTTTTTVAPTTASTTTTTVAPTTASTTTTVAPTPPAGSRRSKPILRAGDAPSFVYKMVVDKSRNRGIVFVTLNDPTVKAITTSEQLCATPYAQCNQLYPQFNVISQGYTHCCTLDAFAPVAAELGLPSFPNVQPLI